MVGLVNFRAQLMSVKDGYLDRGRNGSSNALRPPELLTHRKSTELLFGIFVVVVVYVSHPVVDHLFFIVSVWIRNSRPQAKFPSTTRYAHLSRAVSRRVFIHL